MLKTAGDPLRAAAVGMTAAAAVIVPAATIGWIASGRPPIPQEAVLLALASGILEAAYFGFLAAAYRRGDLSVVYPIARGTAPLLAVAVGIVILGERLGPAGIRRGCRAPDRAPRPPAAVAFPAGRPRIRRPGGRVCPGDRRDDCFVLGRRSGWFEGRRAVALRRVDLGLPARSSCGPGWRSPSGSAAVRRGDCGSPRPAPGERRSVG